MLKSDIRVLEVSEPVAQLFDAYCDALQDSNSHESTLSYLAKFVVAARRDGLDFNGGLMATAMSSEVWGHDIALQNEDFANAMCAVLDELEGEQGL